MVHRERDELGDHRRLVLRPQRCTVVVQVGDDCCDLPARQVTVQPRGRGGGGCPEPLAGLGHPGCVTVGHAGVVTKPPRHRRVPVHVPHAGGVERSDRHGDLGVEAVPQPEHLGQRGRVHRDLELLDCVGQHLEHDQPTQGV